jgi:hypothetical protein
LHRSALEAAAVHPARDGLQPAGRDRRQSLGCLSPLY